MSDLVPKETASQRAAQWSLPPFDSATCEAAASIVAKGPSVVADHFGAELQFGTAGIRGLLGVGTTRMNPYTVSRTIRGIAAYLHKIRPEDIGRGVVVGYDCRHQSWEFAQLAANVLAEAGVRVFLYDRIVPTPLVPHALRRLGAALGIMVTSSHNPPAYNGVKVYAENGAQIVSPVDVEIASSMAEFGYEPPPTDVDPMRRPEVIPLSEPALMDYITWAGLTADTGGPKDVRILYTPLGGTGWEAVSILLEQLGFPEVSVVPEERLPDPNFAGLPGPNPELPVAWERALKMASRTHPEVILATDGDADRIGIAVRKGTGDYRVLTGNEIGTLVLYYLLKRLSQKKRLTGKEFACSSVVSTPLTRKIIESFGGRYYETLTGFKWMGNKAEERLKAGETFIMAFEEAFGVTIGDSRDKDGITCVALLGEMAATMKSEGRTLFDLLDEMHGQFGVHLEAGEERFYEGAEGPDTMRTLLASLRDHPPTELAGSPVIEWTDVLSGVTRTAAETKRVEHLPPQDLLIYRCANGSWMAIRPSGTEPKVKAYVGVVLDAQGRELAAVREEAELRLKQLRAVAGDLL